MFTPAPAGVHQGVCCDIVDMGVLEVTYPGQPPKKAHKVRIVWQIDELMDDGRPFIVQKRYTLSLHEKASLRADLQSWRGRAFTDAELEGFDLEHLLGVNCLLGVVHAQRGADVYANVSAVMPLKKGMPVIVTSKGFVRKTDRTPDEAEQSHGYDGPEPPPLTDDDSIPF
jgi:hypothetical protein